MRILTAEAMREVDRAAIEEIGIPSLVLMENAALGLVEAVTERFPEADAVAIFCGPGNNGGDGLALARHLDARGYGVEVFLGTGGKEPSGDAGVQLSICRKQGISITEVADDADALEALAAAAAADLVVDALFGTGLSRALEGTFAVLVQGLNDLAVPVLAVDLPSGLNGSKAEVFGPHVVADVTVTFAAPKVSQVLPPTAEAVGELWVTDLGIPPFLLERRAAGEDDEGGGDEGELHLLTGDEMALVLPDRSPESHKGTYGHVLVVAGSTGKGGAATLTARAAVRSGAGLVTAAVPEPLVPLVDAGSLESMTVPLAGGPSGQITAAAVDALLATAEGKDVVALGPGLGQEGETAEAIRRAVLGCPLPMVVDADGLNAFAGEIGRFRERSAATILTPHPGELGRLLGSSAREVQENRLGAARRAARESGCVVVLKGNQTLVAVPTGSTGQNPALRDAPAGAPQGSSEVGSGAGMGSVSQPTPTSPEEGAARLEGRGPEHETGAAGTGGGVALHIGPTGNPGMASGGSGDVLTGVLAALLGQLLGAGAAPGEAAAEAACLGVYLHGLAGDLAAEQVGETSLCASDLVDFLPAAFRHLREE